MKAKFQGNGSHANTLPNNHNNHSNQHQLCQQHQEGGGRNKRGNPPQRVEWVNCGFRNPIVGKIWDQFVAKHKDHRSLQQVSTVLRAASLPNDTFIQDGPQPKECLSCQMRDMHPADCNNHHSHKEGKMPDKTARKVAAKLQKGINAINANPEQFSDQRDSNKRSRN